MEQGEMIRNNKYENDFELDLTNNINNNNMNNINNNNNNILSYNNNNNSIKRVNSCNILSNNSNLHSRFRNYADGYSFRELNPTDKARNMELHEICLPVRYNEQFYVESGLGEYLNIVCVDKNSQIVGITIARFQSQWNSEDQDIIDPIYSGNELLYIMTLIVDPDHRRFGIASELLRRLTEKAIKTNPSLRAIYLHVLNSNENAIKFYEANEYIQFKKLTNYYYFHKKSHDAYLYVQYQNKDKKKEFSYQQYIASRFIKIGYCISNCINAVTQN